MSVGINVNQIRSAQYYSQSSHKTQANQAMQTGQGSFGDTQNKVTARALEYQQKQQQRPTSVVDQALAYANSLKASRKKTQDAALTKKKLQYSYKKLSSQIVRSKTSVSAKRAASAARREVQRLKRLKNSGEYDEEELQISIEHAKAMERVAKKKAAHLTQEEMIERTHNGAFAALEEKEEEIQEGKEYEDEELTEDERASEEYDETTNNFALEQDVLIKEVTDDMILRMEEMTKEQEMALRESTEDFSAEMMSMVSDAMEEMNEAMDMSELADTMVAPNPNMSEEDFKMLIIKHRTREMKALSEADGEYLKAIFEKFQRDAAKAGSAASAAASNSAASAPASLIGSGGGSHTPTPVSVTVPGSYGSEGGSMNFEAFV